MDEPNKDDIGPTLRMRDLDFFRASVRREWDKRIIEASVAKTWMKANKHRPFADKDE